MTGGTGGGVYGQGAGMTGWGEVPGTWQGMPTRYAAEEQPPANADAQFYRVGFDE